MLFSVEDSLSFVESSFHSSEMMFCSLLVDQFNLMERINLVYRTSQKISNGAHGNTAGIHGSLSPSSLGSILTAVDVFGQKGVDLGAGNGIVLAAALAVGASSFHGFELPENKANKFFFDATMSMIARKLPRKLGFAGISFEDIDKVLC
jgi:hypothetical protein